MAQPSRKDRTRPVELLILSGGMAVFTGLIVLMATREPLLALIFGVIAFIVALVVLAMLVLAIRPTGEEQVDLNEQNSAGDQGRPSGH